MKFFRVRTAHSSDNFSRIKLELFFLLLYAEAVHRCCWLVSWLWGCTRCKHDPICKGFNSVLTNKGRFSSIISGRWAASIASWGRNWSGLRVERCWLALAGSFSGRRSGMSKMPRCGRRHVQVKRDGRMCRFPSHVGLGIADRTIQPCASLISLPRKSQLGSKSASATFSWLTNFATPEVYTSSSWGSFISWCAGRPPWLVVQC